MRTRTCLSIILLCLLVLTGLLAGCGGMKPTGGNSGAATYSVTDDQGTVITFKEPPRHIYANTVSLEEVLLDLVPPERIAAVTASNKDRRISFVADKADRVERTLPEKPSLETVLSIRPDLVLAQDKARPEFIKALRDAGIPVFVMEVPVTLPKIRQRILKLGEVTGEKEKAAAVVADLDRKVAAVHEVTDRIPMENRRIIMAYSLNGVFGSPQGLFHHICLEAGVQNGAALAGLKRGDHVSKEQILRVDPDILIFPDYSSTVEGDATAFRQSVITDPALQPVKAVRNGRILVIHDRYRYAASQYVGDAIRDIAEKCYPEYFTKQYK